MADEFSFVGYESVPVAEYLPILDKIKHDLRFIYEQCISAPSKDMTTLEAPNSDMIIDPELPKKSKDMVDASVKTDFPGSNELVPETSPEITNSVLELLTLLHSERNYPEPGEDLTTLLRAIKEEITQSNQVNKEKETKMNEMKEQIEEQSAEIVQKDGKIDALKSQRNECKEELIKKDQKIDTLNKNLKSVKDELQQQSEKVSELEEELSKIKKEFSTIKTEKDVKKPTSDMRQILEEKIKKITELENKLTRLESKNADNADYQETIRDLENKIKKMEIQNDIESDENYQQLLGSLKEKRKELRERDSKIQDLESDISDLESAKRKLEKENRNFSKRIEELKQELLEAEKQKDDLECKYKIKCKECRGMMKSNFGNDDVERYKEDIKKLEEKIKDKDSRYDSLMKKNKENLSLIESNKEKLTEKEKRLKENEEEKKKLMEKFEGEMKTLLIENEKKTSAIEKMRDKIKGQAEVQTDQTDIKKLQNLVKHKDMELEQYHAKVENLNEGYEKKATEYDMAQKTIQQLRKELEDVKRLNFIAKAPNVSQETSRQREPKDDVPDWWKKHMI